MLRSLVPALLLLAGRVTDPLGAPAAGIEVWDLTAGHGPQRLAVTGADGRFVLPEMQSDVFVELCGPGFLTQGVIARRGGEPIRVVLEPAARVAGRVLDAVTGSPVAGANVWGRQLTDSGVRCAFSGDGVCPRDRSARTTRTGPDGSFLVDHFEPGLYRLHVEAPGYLKAPPFHLKLAAGEARVPDVLVERGAVLRGRVLGSDGKPLGEVRLFASSGRSNHNDVKSDADGRYVLTGLEPGLVWVHLQPPELDYAQRSVEVGPGENEADFHLSAHTAHELRGRVVDAAGRPVGDARVRWEERGGGGAGETRSAADGAFALPSGDGIHELSAEAAGYAPGRLERPVVVRGAPVEGLEIRLADAATLRGRVLGADPEQRRQGVEAYQRGVYRQAELDAEDRFTLTGLGPGLWRLRAGATGVGAEAEVRIAPGEREVDFDLEVHPMVEIQGRVLAPDGTPQAYAGVQARALGQPRPLWGHGAGKDGTFAFRVHPGSYILTASWEGLASVTAEEPLEVGEAPVAGIELRLGEAVPLHGRIVGLSVEELIDVEVLARQGEIEHRTRVDPAAEFELSDVGPGPWELTARLRREGGVRIARARIGVGEAGAAEPAEIVFPAGPPLTLRGQVADEAAAGLWIDLRQEGDAADERLISTLTDEAGGFVFAGLGAGRYVLAVRDSIGYRRSSLKAMPGPRPWT